MSILIATVVFSQLQISPSQKEMLEAAANEYQKNRMVFSSGEIRFTLLSGKCNSFEDAKSGNFRGLISSKGLYIFTKNVYRYERIYDESKSVAKIKKIDTNHFMMPSISFRALTDGITTMRDDMYPDDQFPDKFQHNVIVSSGTQAFFKDQIFPVPFGFLEGRKLDFDVQIRDALTDGSGVTVDMQIYSNCQNMEKC